MLNHNGRIVVVTDNAGAERTEMRADRAIDMLDIGRRIVRRRSIVAWVAPTEANVAPAPTRAAAKQPSTDVKT